MNVHGIMSVCNQFTINNVKQTSPLNIERDDRTKKIFQITFDIHQDNTYVNYCLATLKKYNIKATFFLTNNFIKKFPQDVLNILKDGHIIGNHAKHIFFKSPADVISSLKETEQSFKSLTGQDMPKIWRTPYLQHYGKNWMLKVAQKQGYQHIDASLCSVDWEDNNSKRYLNNNDFMTLFENNFDFSAYSRMHINKTNINQYKRNKTNYNGVILLLHPRKYRGDDRDFVLCLEPIIKHLIKNNYKFDSCDKFISTAEKK